MDTVRLSAPQKYCGDNTRQVSQGGFEAVHASSLSDTGFRYVNGVLTAFEYSNVRAHANMPYEQYPSIPAHRLFHHKGTSFPLSPPRKAWIRTGENAFNLEKLWLPLPGSAFARYCLARVCCLHQKRHCDSLSWASFQFSDKLSCRLQDDPLWEWAGRWVGYKAGNFHARSTGLPLFSSCLRSACSQPDTSPQTSKCRASDLDLDLVPEVDLGRPWHLPTPRLRLQYARRLRSAKGSDYSDHAPG